MPVTAPLLLSALMFSAGVYGLLARRHAILVLLSIELMINAANINLITFSQYLNDHVGNIVTLFIIALTAAEVGVGLGIFLMLYRRRSTVAVDDMQLLKW